jgi:hypothetical protein
MKELLNCPFCNCESHIVIGVFLPHKKCYSPKCKKCKCSLGIFFTEQAAIKAWNTRISPIKDLAYLDERKLSIFMSEKSFTLPKELKIEFGKLWAKEICNTFSLPNVPTIEELEKLIEKNKWFVAKKAMSGEQSLGNSLELAQQIYTLISNKNKEK